MYVVGRILSLLADGQFHSGEALGKSLGMSRAAIWKQLQKIEAIGIKLHSVKGRGYRLVTPLSLLNESKIASHLTASAAEQLSLSVFQSTASTNEDVKKIANSTSGVHVVLAEHQTQGRGRRGRSWVSPFGCNVYFSFSCPLDNFGANAVDGLSLAVGVAVAEVIENLCEVTSDLRCHLKWPNDILINKQKVAGILIELSGVVGEACQIIIGIGINVNMDADGATGIDQPWTSLAAQVGRMVDRNELCAQLINKLTAVKTVFAEQGFSAYKEQWERRDAYRDLPVYLVQGEEKTVGIARGVTEKGLLLLETDEGVQTVYGGEVSLRGMA